MANYDLVVNSKFQPFSFERYIQPYQMYGEAYKEVENQYGKLAAKANIWEEIANEQTDPYAYKMYKTYANDLENKALQLAREGLNAASRKDMLNMKARYSKEITPIEQAYTRRRELNDKWLDMKAKDNTLMYLRDPNNPHWRSLDRFIEDSEYNYGTPISGALITKRVADELKNYKATMVRSGNWESTALGLLLLRRESTGLTREDIVNILQNPDSFPEIKQLIDNVVTSTGILNWEDEEAVKNAYIYAYEALPAGLGKEDIEVQKDLSYMNEYEKWKLEKLKRDLNDSGGSNLEDSDTESLYFPDIELNTISQDYNIPNTENITYKNGVFSDSTIEAKLKELYEKNSKLNEGNSYTRNAALGYSIAHKQLAGSTIQALYVRLKSYEDKLERLQKKLSNETDLSERVQLEKQISRTKEDIFDIKQEMLGVSDQASMRGAIRKQILDLENKNKKISDELNEYSKKFSHIIKDPVAAVRLGVALDKLRSLKANRGLLIKYGEDNKSSEFIIDSALESARAASHTGIYEVNDKGEIERELRKKDLPESSEGMLLLGTNKGFMYSDKDGKKYLIRSNSYFNNLSSESESIDNYLDNFDKSNSENIIDLEGNIYQNGRLYDEQNVILYILNSGIGKQLSNNSVAASFRQADGDIVNVVIYDANTSHPGIAYSSVSDILNGGQAKSSTYNKYKTYRAGFLREDLVNKKSSPSLGAKEELIVR